VQDASGFVALGLDAAPQQCADVSAEEVACQSVYETMLNFVRTNAAGRCSAATQVGLGRRWTAQPPPSIFRGHWFYEAPV
jgi:hypothetical protein